MILKMNDLETADADIGGLMSQGSGRRMGGREARRQKRAQELPEEMKPVRSGQESGRYIPLSESEMDTIHENALTEVSVELDRR